MNRFLPIKRAHQQLPCRAVAGDRLHQPVERHGERVGCERVQPALERGEQREVDKKTVAQQQVHHAQIQDRRRKDRIERARVGEQPQQIDGPHDRRHQRGHEGAADEQLEAEKPTEAERAIQIPRCAHVHQVGLHVTLDPARALPQPVGQIDVGFLEGGGVEHAHALTRLRHAHAQIGILCDVVRIPGLELAQMRGAEVVRGAAERNRNAQAFQRRQEVVEPQRILQREHAREPVLRRVVVVQTRLHAHHVGRRTPERHHRLLQLIGLGLILGIEDGDELAARERQRVVARLGLGARQRVRHADDLERARQAQRLGRLDRLDVVGLQDQLHVELRLRIVHALQRRGKRRQHIGLAVHRHQDRVRGQTGVVERAHVLVGHLEVEPVGAAVPGEHELEREDAEQERRGHGVGSDQHAEWREREPHQQRGDCQPGEHQLPAREHRARREPRLRGMQRIDGLRRDALALGALQMPLHVELGGDDGAHVLAIAGAQQRIECRTRIGARHDQLAVVAAAPRQILPAVVFLDQPIVDQLRRGRMLDQIHERHAQMPRERLVERQRAHPALRQHDLAQPAAPAYLQPERLFELARGDQPGFDEGFA